MRRTQLGAIALGIAGAAIAGYGAAMGRDAWHATKRNWIGLLVLGVLTGAIALPILGGRNLCRGYPKDSMDGISSGTPLIFGGGLLIWAILTFLSGTELTNQQQLMVVGLVAVLAVFGMLVGIAQRSKRLEMFQIADANEDFLERHGFQETAETEISHYDSDGNPLRLSERTEDSIVFFAVGRRNKRAYIQLSENGTMLGYTGVISIGEPRVYQP